MKKENSYKKYKIHEYFFKLFKTKFKISDLNEKINLLITYQPKIIVLDLCGGLLKYSCFLNIDFDYYGFYDINNNRDFFNKLIESDCYKIVFTGDCKNNLYCFCLNCKIYDEQTLILTL